MTDTPYAIEITGARKAFESTVAVEGLDLRVPHGATYGLLGPNGSGKTTTIRMILRILEPDAGAIRVLGAPVSPAILERLGYLPEERGLYRRMTVRRVLVFLAELKGLPPRESRPRIDRWLERLGLLDRGDSRVLELSKGMQQKLQFLAAVVHDPEIVILDEPFSGLDPINQEALRAIVGELRAAGRTILFSTHMIEHAERLCDHVCILAKGWKVVDGPVSEIKRGHRGTRVALALERWDPAAAATIRAMAEVAGVTGEGNELEVALAEGADPQAFLARLVERGLRLRRFELAEPTLRQIFIERAGDTPQADTGVRETGGQHA